MVQQVLVLPEVVPSSSLYQRRHRRAGAGLGATSTSTTAATGTNIFGSGHIDVSSTVASDGTGTSIGTSTESVVRNRARMMKISKTATSNNGNGITITTSRKKDDDKNDYDVEDNEDNENNTIDDFDTVKRSFNACDASNAGIGPTLGPVLPQIQQQHPIPQPFVFPFLFNSKQNRNSKHMTSSTGTNRIQQNRRFLLQQLQKQLQISNRRRVWGQRIAKAFTLWYIVYNIIWNTFIVKSLFGNIHSKKHQRLYYNIHGGLIGMYFDSRARKQYWCNNAVRSSRSSSKKEPKLVITVQKRSNHHLTTESNTYLYEVLFHTNNVLTKNEYELRRDEQARSTSYSTTFSLYNGDYFRKLRIMNHPIHEIYNVTLDVSMIQNDIVGVASIAAIAMLKLEHQNPTRTYNNTTSTGSHNSSTNTNTSTGSSSTSTRHNKNTVPLASLLSDGGTRRMYKSFTSYSMEKQLEKFHCRPSWFCQRCLNSPTKGTFYRCNNTCPKCYFEFLTQHQLLSSSSTVLPVVTSHVYHNNNNNNEMDMVNQNLQQQKIRTRKRAVQISTHNIALDDTDDHDGTLNVVEGQNNIVSPSPNFDYQYKSRIPPLVHQSWHIYLDSIMYPELGRIQNAWKSMMPLYKYTTYYHHTDDHLRNYIVEHYGDVDNSIDQRIDNDNYSDERYEKSSDNIFVQVYDLLKSSSSNQHDYYRFLVLLREGGIYSTIDLLPEVNILKYLQSDPKVSFIAAREDDSVAMMKDTAPKTKDPRLLNTYGNTKNCIWNGFIATEPGHPIIITIVESILESVLLYGPQSNRIERTVLSLAATFSAQSTTTSQSQSPSHESIAKFVEVWKLRSSRNKVLQDSYVFNGCSIGMAINDVLNNPDPLADMQLGKHVIPNTNNSSYINILMMSQHDTGAFRCTDVETNTLIASTNMIGLDRLTLEQRTKQSDRRSRSDRFTAA